MAAASCSASNRPFSGPTGAGQKRGPRSAERFAAGALTAVMAASAGNLPASANVKTPIDASYKLVFDEEFSDPALRNDRWTANWLGCPTCITPPVQAAKELAAYDPASVSVASGKLRLSLAKNPVTIGDKTYKFRSGMIQSNGLAEFSYGYFEARIQMPISGKTNKIANWPAFWMDGQVWPTDGENDIAEALSGNACYHFHSPEGGPGNCAAGNYTGWHVFGALWEPGSVTYYYDGRKVGQITRGVTSAPMFLILNHGMSPIGGALRAPAVMKVDYVHVYSKDPTAIAVTPDPGYGGPGDDGLTAVIASSNPAFRE